MATPLDLSPPALPKDGIGSLAYDLIGSEILKIAGQVRAIKESGAPVSDFTVGDFSPAQFRSPEPLEAAIVRALQAGETNYPPSDGVPALRKAVVAFYQRHLGLDYPLEGVAIASGARPVLWASYRTVLEDGDRVIYPVPSWNNNHYIHLCRAQGVAIPTLPENGFLPTAAQIAPHLAGASLIALNSPLNPAGTGFSADEVRAIATLVVDENRRREARGERPVFLLYDHIYWTLAADSAPHFTPPGLVPEVAKYTLFVDGISKGFAATGLRVGWVVGPPYIVKRMRDLLGHVGAWAPRAEQIATAEVLADPDAGLALVEPIKNGLIARLERLHAGLEELRRAGAPVRALPPAGALYLSVQFDLLERFGTDDQLRRFLLEEAGLAAVPFRAFGLEHDSGWLRLSVGAVGLTEIDAAIGRLRPALERLTAAVGS
ncbi:MAG: aminotransferase class I/II-fold pyridoxal phosphate-dependent enzyme [Thermoanaerobaculia bacterium]|nr:aminotransferase class I/II-fold pyridoxal phosphate-dependent enzyme [Thermoanaerobaculia bacterium]